MTTSSKTVTLRSRAPGLICVACTGTLLCVAASRAEPPTRVRPNPPGAAHDVRVRPKELTAPAAGGLASAILELRADAANGATAYQVPGAASPWVDLISTNDAALVNFAGTAQSGWQGDGTPIDPYRLQFDGVNDYLTIPGGALPGLQGNNNYSFGIWFKTAANVTNSQYLVEWVEQVPPGSPWSGMTIRIEGSTLDLWRGSSNGGFGTFYAGVQPNTWYHLIVTKQPGLAATYVNGVGEGTFTTPNIGDQNSAIILGGGIFSNNPPESVPLQGSIAHVTIYDATLSAGEALSEYQAGESLYFPECLTDSACDDNDVCNGIETCNIGTCVSGTALDCDDANVCTDDMCHPIIGCQNVPDDSNACADSDVCNGIETCVSGVCMPGTALVCDDANACTDDSCNPVFGCAFTNNNDPCDDGVFCNGADACAGGSCAPGAGDPCPGQSCDELNEACTSTVMTCQTLGTRVVPSATVPVDIMLELATDVRAYNTKIAITQTAGSGSLAMPCPNGLAVDESRPDYLFSALSDTFLALDCAEARAGSASLEGSAGAGGTPRYLADYSLQVSGGATVGATFEIAMEPEPGSRLRDSANAPIPFVVGPPCVVIVETADIELNLQVGSESIEVGEQAVVTLDVANLSLPINGLEAVVTYDPATLAFVSAEPTDLGPPPESSWFELLENDTPGVLHYAVGILDGSMQADSTVATLTFQALTAGTTTFDFAPDAMPLVTRLTAAADASVVLPARSASGLVTVSSCDDGNACTVDTFDGDNCVNTPIDPAVECNDSNACTIDACDTVIGCTNTPDVDANCDDGSACTASDQCDAGGNCVGTPVNCDDSNGCTIDDCDPGTGCTNTPDTGAACDDADACTQGDACDGAGMCVGTPLDPAVDCDDSNACTIDACDTLTGCTNTPDDGAACDDGNACTLGDQCDAGASCVGTPLDPPVDCNDFNVCTIDACDPGSGCANTIDVGAACDDSNSCTENDACNAGGMCVGDVIPDCTECTTSPECDDGNVCNGLETCQAQACVSGTPLNCDDGSLCTTDTCDAITGCSSTPNYDDAVDCCDPSTGALDQIDDGSACTTDSCDPGSGQTSNAPLYDVATECCNPADGSTTLIDDGSACTTDTCNAGTGQVTHAPTYDIVTECCDPADGGTTRVPDGDACTDDLCDVLTGNVTHIPNYDLATECCDPSDAGTEPLADGDLCTLDLCDEATGVVTHLPSYDVVTECCDPADGTIMPLDDMNECTDDFCNPGTGEVTHVPNNDFCDDLDDCTESDMCQGGVCAGSSIDCSDGMFCNGAEPCVLGVCEPAVEGPCTDACEHCDEDDDVCAWCIFDLDFNGVMGTGDFALFSSCFGQCYASADPCAASNFDGDAMTCVGTADYAGFLGCFGDDCASCAGCVGAPGGPAPTAPESVAVRIVAVASQGPSDIAKVPPTSDAVFAPGQRLFLEIWARVDGAPRPDDPGLASVYVNLVTDPQALRLQSVVGGQVMSMFARGDLAASKGRVDDLGGSIVPGAAAVGVGGSWVRVTAVRAQALAAGTHEVKVGYTPGLYGVSRVGSFHHVGGDDVRLDGVHLQVHRPRTAARKRLRR